MCFNANMSLGLGVIGLVASGITVLDKQESIWVRAVRAYAIFHFSLMEFIQYFAYPVADQCGYGTNLWLSELSTYHISLQAFAIMPALATYSSDKQALKKAILLGSFLSGSFLVCNFLPKEWQVSNLPPNFIGDLVACLTMGKYHIAYLITSAFGEWIMYGSLFALALSGYLWKDNKKMANYHFVMALLTLYAPQIFFGTTTGEAAAIYCLYSIPITGSFMPMFKKFFMAPEYAYQSGRNEESVLGSGKR